MSRGRKPNKRVEVRLQLDMSHAEFKEMRSGLQDKIAATFPGTLVYLSVDADVKSS